MAQFFQKFRQILSSLRPGEGFSRDDATPFEPLTIGELVVTCQSTWLSDLTAWDTLCRRISFSTTFHAPRWQIAAWTAGKIRGRLRFVQVHRQKSLIAVLPLCFNDAGGLHSPGASISDYLDPLVDPECEAACWEAILQFVNSQWDHNVVEFTLHNLRATASARAMLAKFSEKAGFEVSEKVAEHAPAIQLPSSWDAFLGSLDSHDRKELRRKLNKAEIKGNAELSLCQTSAEIQETLPRAIEMMEAAGGEKAAAVAGYLGPLLRATADDLHREGRLELYRLHIQGKLACCLLQFPSPSGPMLYNLGFDAAQAEWSPGVVAVGMSIRNAITNQATCFDLLRGRETYKYRLGGVDQPLFKLTLKKR